MNYVRHAFFITISFAIVSLVTLAFTSIIKLDVFFKQENGKIMAQVSENVNVTAEVRACVLEIKVYPEKRFPRVGNWGTALDIQIFTLGNSYLGSVYGSSGSDGVATINICDQGLNLADGTYNIYVRGYSHLRMNFNDHHGFSTASSDLDLTTDGDELFAGETSNIYNNFINTLDLSTQISRMETVDIKNDLNRDGEVNVLDIANTITNYLLSGDCSPKETADGVC